MVSAATQLDSAIRILTEPAVYLVGRQTTDDAELGLRGRLAGWRCIYALKAVVYHRLGSTLGRHSEQRIFLIERNRIWLAAKLFPLRLLCLSPFYFSVRLIATAAASLALPRSARY